MALIALDTSVLIALLDPDDAHHRAAGALLSGYADEDLRRLLTADPRWMSWSRRVELVGG